MDDLCTVHLCGAAEASDSAFHFRSIHSPSLRPRNCRSAVRCCEKSAHLLFAWTTFADEFLGLHLSVESPGFFLLRCHIYERH